MGQVTFLGTLPLNVPALSAISPRNVLTIGLKLDNHVHMHLIHVLSTSQHPLPEINIRVYWPHGHYGLVIRLYYYTLNVWSQINVWHSSWL